MLPSMDVFLYITVWEPSSCINTCSHESMRGDTWSVLTIMLLMKYLSLAGGREAGEVQLMASVSPTLYLRSVIIVKGWMVTNEVITCALELVWVSGWELTQGETPRSGHCWPRLS